MLAKEHFVDILVLNRQEKSIRQIAEELQLSRNTARKYIRQPNLVPCDGPRPKRPSKLEPYHDYLLQRIAAARPHWIPAVVLLTEIKQRGYQGGITILRNFIRKYKSTEEDKWVRFETPPGKQLQIDFTTIRRGKNTIKAFVATLGYSGKCT